MTRIEVFNEDNTIKPVWSNFWGAFEDWSCVNEIPKWNGRVVFSEKDDNFVSHLEFATEADAMVFLLRWA